MTIKVNEETASSLSQTRNSGKLRRYRHGYTDKSCHHFLDPNGAWCLHSEVREMQQTAPCFSSVVDETHLTLSADQWQPIETAPKDGTEILLAHGNSQWIDWWTNVNAIGGFWCMCDQWETPEVPTHWMPLPNLPNPITQDTASASALSQNVPDESSVQHEPESESDISSTLAEIRERRSKISETPWGYDLNGYVARIDDDEWGLTVAKVLGSNYEKNGNGEFIANAPSDIDTLRSVIDSLQAEKDALNRHIELAFKAAAGTKARCINRVLAKAETTPYAVNVLKELATELEAVVDFDSEDDQNQNSVSETKTSLP